MSEFDYADLASEAAAIIEDAGRDFTFSRLGREPADESKPWRSPTTDEDATLSPLIVSDVKAVEYDSVRDVRSREIMRLDSSRLIVAQDSFAAAATLAGIDPVPDITTFDRASDGTHTWRIKSIKPLIPGPVALIHIIELEE